MNEPFVIADDLTEISYSAARKLWENGDFSEWIETHGFPVIIAGESFSNWTGVEAALSDDQWDVNTYH